MIFLLFFLFALLLIIIIICVIFFVLNIIGLLKTKVPYLPAPREMVSAIINALELKPGSVIYDLGSGDSEVLRKILLSELSATGIGIELSPLPHFIARLWNFIKPEPRLTLVNENFFDFEVINATHIFLYLLPSTMDKLLPKLLSELKPGCCVVSCDFQFKNKEPLSIVDVKTSKNRTHKLFIYEF